MAFRRHLLNADSEFLAAAVFDVNKDGKLDIGAIHTYVELYARLLVDLIPNVVLVCAEKADEAGTFQIILIDMFRQRNGEPAKS